MHEILMNSFCMYKRIHRVVKMDLQVFDKIDAPTITSFIFEQFYIHFFFFFFILIIIVSIMIAATKLTSTTKKWQHLRREMANLTTLFVPWQLRIKEIESHFGSVVASYFTFLRWLFWVNIVLAFTLSTFVILPEVRILVTNKNLLPLCTMYTLILNNCIKFDLISTRMLKIVYCVISSGSGRSSKKNVA